MTPPPCCLYTLAMEPPMNLSSPRDNLASSCVIPGHPLPPPRLVKLAGRVLGR